MRWIEFFEAEDGRLSMTRLLCFLSFFVSSYVVFICADKKNIADVLGWYIGGYVLGYVGGRLGDVFTQKKGARHADTAQPD